MENTELTSEQYWHLDTGDSVMYIDSASLEQWLKDGAILPDHRISRDGARWLEIGRVPYFAAFCAPVQVADPFGANVPPTAASAQAPAAAVQTAPSVRGFSPAYQTYVNEAVQMNNTAPSHLVPSMMNAPPPSFGLRIAAGLAFAMVVAGIGAYLWAFHISGHRDINAISKEPRIVELQKRYDHQKDFIETARLNYKPPVEKKVETPAAPKLGPMKMAKTVPNMMKSQVEQITENMRESAAAGHIEMPKLWIPQVPPRDFNAELTQLTNKFENDKSLAVTEIRDQDRKARILPAFLILFLGLGGFNAMRIKMSAKK